MTIGGVVRIATEWIATHGVVNEWSCAVPLIGCYRIEPHREGWMQLSLEGRMTGKRVLVVCDNVEELKAFAASHVQAMMAGIEPKELNYDNK